MQQEPGEFPVLSRIKTYGLSKVALVIIFLLCLGIFTSYVLGSFTGIIVEGCKANFPYLDCDGTGHLLLNISSVLASMFGPLLTFEWLLKKSFLFLMSLLVGVFLIIIGSILFLKNRYESIQA